LTSLLRFSAPEMGLKPNNCFDLVVALQRSGNGAKAQQLFLNPLLRFSAPEMGLKPNNFSTRCCASAPPKWG